MAILHILTPEYPPATGGVADYTRLIARKLAQAGDAVHVWCPPNAERERSKPGLNKLLDERSRIDTPHSSGRHRADADTQEQRCNDAGARENAPPAALGRVLLIVIRSKGECRSPENDAHQHEREWNVEYGAESGIHRGEAGESEDDGQNQPDVIGFPDRTNGMSDHVPLPRATRTGS